MSMNEQTYLAFMEFMGTWFGQVVIFFSLFGFYYHLSNGIRHLVWDTGYGYDLSTVRFSGWTVVIMSIGATLLTWSLA